MKIIIFITSIFFFTNIQSQNLVPNPSFEDFKKCPEKVSQIKKTLYWVSPTVGTPDYYNSCNNGEVGIPINTSGYQFPFNGNAYIGIILYSKNDSYREYVQVKLVDKLEKHKIYKLSLYVCLRESSLYSIDKIEVFFSNNKIKSKKRGILDSIPQISNNIIIKDTLKWTLISGYYKAKGNEEYLIIGNFQKNKDLQILKNKVNANIEKKAYYYIDNVSLVQVEETDSIRKILNPPKKQAQRNILKNVNFETNKSELLPESHETLDTLANILFKNKNLHIELYGHTDSTGQEIDNYALSFARAESVLNYLVQKGVSRERLTAIGLGSSEPIAPNKTKEGRLTNRRVDFILIDNSMKFR
ncbi:MAG: OmpA family protein [Bacteroidales bacterium]|jgi:OOP family OmpA-OmpF porin|nr:OmpA family protein [Bacteroidales bacterium]